MCDISVTVEVDRHMQWPNLLVLNPDHGKGSDEGWWLCRMCLRAQALESCRPAPFLLLLVWSFENIFYLPRGFLSIFLFLKTVMPAEEAAVGIQWTDEHNTLSISVRQMWSWWDHSLLLDVVGLGKALRVREGAEVWSVCVWRALWVRAMWRVRVWCFQQGCSKLQSTLALC